MKFSNGSMISYSQYKIKITNNIIIKVKNIYAILICSFKEVPQHSLQHLQQFLQNADPAQQSPLIANEMHITNY